jgi:hypothetical protein
MKITKIKDGTSKELFNGYEENDTENYCEVTHEDWTEV